MLIKTTEVKVPKRIYLFQQYGFNIAYTSYKCSSVPNENSVMFFFFVGRGCYIRKKKMWPSTKADGTHSFLYDRINFTQTF